MKTSCIVLALVLSAVCVQVCVAAQTVDSVIATVGDEVILQSDLMQELAPVINEIRQTASSEEEFNKAVDEQVRLALEQAIEYKILLRQALQAGATIDDKAVEERVNEIKKRFGSNENFEKELAKAGQTMSDMRARVREQILAISMGMQKRREFEKQVEVTETDVAQYYADNPEQFVHPERIQVRRIFMAAKSDNEKDIAAKMADLKKQLDEGADFAELAKTHSTGPDAEDGGLLGWVQPNDLVQSLEDALFALPEGGVTDVLRTEYGFVLLKAEKKDVAGTVTLEEARKEIEPALRAQFAGEKYVKWMNELRKRSRVRIFL